MPPPVSYVEIDSVPFSRIVTMAEFNVADEFWFQFITTVNVAFGEWTSKPGGFGLFCNIYESDGTTLVVRTGSSEGFWYLLPIGTYYIKIDRFPVLPVADDVTYQADTRPMDDIEFEVGSVLISDDATSQLAAIIIETDAVIPTFVSAIPTGEIADSLPNGYCLFHDRFGKYTTNALILFNTDLVLTETIVPSTPFTGLPRICHSTTDFYATNPNTGQVWKITTEGVCTLFATIADIASNGVIPVGINSDATIMYYSINDGSGEIKKYVVATDTSSVHYTIPGFVPGDDRIAFTFDSNPGDLIVLPDGSYVTWWTNDLLSTSNVIHISEAGALLNTITYADPDSIDHLHYASVTLSTHIKAWLFRDLGAQSTIGNLNLTTGVFDVGFTIDTFSAGQNQVSGDSDKFGPASSCAMITLFDTDISGIYFVDPATTGIPPIPTLKHDVYRDEERKIPDPTIRTALIGE